MSLRTIGIVMAAVVSWGGVAGAQGIVIKRPQIEMIASGVLKEFGNGYITVETNDKGTQQIQIFRDTWVNINLEMPLTDLPPNSVVRVWGKLNPQSPQKITDWHIEYYPQEAVAGSWVYINEGDPEWEVHYAGRLMPGTPMRLATLRGTGYYARRQSTGGGGGFGGAQNMNQRPTSAPIRNPRPDLEGAVFMLDLGDADNPNVNVNLLGKPQFAGKDARVFVWGVQGTPPKATSVSINRTEPFELPKAPITTKKK